MENTIQQTEITQPIKYAGFGKRFAAMIIDRVIIVFFSGSMYWEFQKVISWYLKKIKNATGDDDFSFTTGIYEKVEALAFSYYMLFTAIIVWCYYAGMESSPWKATLGKKLLGLEVSKEDGSRLSFTRATGRHFGKILSGALIYIGYLVMLGHDKKQTWHDSMSKSVVTEK